MNYPAFARKATVICCELLIYLCFLLKYVLWAAVSCCEGLARREKTRVGGLGLLLWFSSI
jgi:hypothetical protein